MSFVMYSSVFAVLLGLVVVESKSAAEANAAYQAAHQKYVDSMSKTTALMEDLK